MINKKNLPLVLALSIPIIMILVVAGFIYLPSLGKKPQFDFMYVTGGNIYYYNYGQREYYVKNGMLIHEDISTSTNPNYYSKPVLGSPHFYIYDVKNNSAKEISFEDTQKYNLDSSAMSPDAYQIQRGSGGGDFSFGGMSDYNNWYIKGYNRGFKLNLKLSADGYNNYDNFQFIGWLITSAN